MRLRVALVPLALLAMAALAAPTAAQSTDFSGTWRLDADASELPDFEGRGRRFGGRGGRRQGGGGGLGGGARTLVVVQTPAALIIEQQSDRGSRAATYRLDGEESTNPGLMGGEQTTRSRWDGAALVTEGAQSVNTPRGDFTLEFTERRTLSADGQTMTVEASRSTPRGDIDTTLVYRRE